MTIKRRGKRFSSLLALVLLAMFAQATIDVAISCPAAYNTARFCSSGNKFVQGGKEQ
jgi:hypothetical protein